MAKIIKKKEEAKPKKHLFYVTKCVNCKEQVVIRDDELFYDEGEECFRCECGHGQILDISKIEIYDEDEIVIAGYLNQEDVDSWDSEEQEPSKETKTPKEQLINDIMENFDFEKVLKTMIALDWKWASSKTHSGIPMLFEIMEHARKQLSDTYDRKSIISCGGFQTEYHEYDDGEVHLGMSFCVDGWDSYWSYNDNELKYY